MNKSTKTAVLLGYPNQNHKKLTDEMREALRTGKKLFLMARSSKRKTTGLSPEMLAN